MKPNNKIKVCYVVCYSDPNYIRTLILLSALRINKNIDLIVVNNKITGGRARSILRYIEMPFKLIVARLKYQPDVFIIGFRADEIFWLMYPTMIGKKKIFDEFVNIHDWFTAEHNWFSASSVLARILDNYMHWVMNQNDIILTDTSAHAQLASKVFNTPISKFRPIPVATDEEIFYPRVAKQNNQKFEIFFPGNMLPLHGLEVILEALKQILLTTSSVHVTLAGGRGKRTMLKRINSFIHDNDLQRKITYLPWIDYKKLPNYISKADLCLGGPFGVTSQASRVIPGKTFQFLAMAKAAVIGKNSAHKYFVDKQNCLIVKRGDPKALAGAVKWAIANRNQLEKIGLEGNKLYSKYYSVKVVTKELQSILDEVS